MDRYGQYVKGPGGNVTEVRGVLASAIGREGEGAAGEASVGRAEHHR